jgi:hypothetical protein
MMMRTDKDENNSDGATINRINNVERAERIEKASEVYGGAASSSG